MTEDKNIKKQEEKVNRPLTEEEIEEMLDNGAYPEGMDAGRTCKSSYNEGVETCPYTDKDAKDNWIAGFDAGFALKSLS